MNYKDLNDNELIYYINDSSEEAKEILFKKYMPLIEKKAYRYKDILSKTGLEVSDLIQEGLLAINHCIDYFDSSKNITFYTFVSTCIDNRIINLITKNSSNKHKALNEAINYEMTDENGNDFILGDIISDNSYNPEDVVVNKDSSEELISKAKAKLTDFECQVFDLKLSGFDYKEIAKALDKSPKSIDNALQRIKSKIKE
ncbi:MAG: sigma-70 family RNA polymerase sigma factor [Bacilli bacterium]|nr:sigma-70 family RNA polymerase sigma factor [Bacilli bacterium]